MYLDNLDPKTAWNSAETLDGRKERCRRPPANRGERTFKADAKQKVRRQTLQGNDGYLNVKLQPPMRNIRAIQNPKTQPRGLYK